jgi:serine/threonine protein kinase
LFDGKRYKLGRIIDNGSFGIVFEALDREEDCLVAVKRIFIDHRFLNRELQMLQALGSHHAIITLNDYYYSSPDPTKDRYLHLVTELMPDNLSDCIKRAKKGGEALPLDRVRGFARQLFEGLAHTHGREIIHRDVKPQNILVNKHRIKLCDWGSAKPEKTAETDKSVTYICSRYYRAPELLFGCTYYNSKVDVWSAACVVAEMLKLSPLFPGRSSKNQLVTIINVLGSPSAVDVESMNRNYKPREFPKVNVLPFEANFPPTTSQKAIDFVKALLIYDWQKRPSAE